MFNREAAAHWIARSSRATTVVRRRRPLTHLFLYLSRDSFASFPREFTYSPYNAAITAFAISAVPLLPPNSIGLIPSA